MKRKRVDKEIDIPVVLDSSDKKTPTNTEIQFAMERYRVFARSLFGDDYEVGAIKINTGKEDPSKITMLRVQKEFILAQKARGNSKETIKAYETNFNRLYDFLGFQYAKQSKEVLEDILDNPEKYQSSRTIGASLPVIVFELPNFMAFYQDYLANICKVSPHTVVSSIRHIKAIIYFTQERGWVREYGIKIKELKPEIKDTFTQYELNLLGKKPKLRSDNFVEYRTWVMIQYLSSTGNRIGSVLALDVKDIDFENGIVYRNGEALVEEYTRTPTTRRSDVQFPIVVEEGTVFVMGDNRNISKDSRSNEIGLIDTREILGKALFVFFPGNDGGDLARDFSRIGVVN